MYVLENIYLLLWEKEKVQPSKLYFFVVRPGRLELPSHCWHMDLNHARLPIPPRAHILNFKLLAFTQAVFVYSLKKGSRT